MKKAWGYWNSENNIVSELKKITKNLGHFPTCTELPGGLWGAIKKTKKSIFYYGKLLGWENKTKPKKYWQFWENISYEIKKLIVLNNGVFPKLTQIEEHLGSGGKLAVRRNGGIRNVAEKMGYNYIPTGNCIKVSDGHVVLSYNELIVDEFLYSRDISHEVNGYIHKGLPYRFDFKINDFYIELWGYEKNRKTPRCDKYNKRRQKKEKLYKELDLKLINIESGVFKKPINSIIACLTKMCETMNLNTKEIRPINLTNYIANSKYWTYDKILYNLRNFITSLGRFPKQKDFIENKLGGLIDAISRNGGLIYFANILGYNFRYKIKWDINKITTKLKDIINKLGYFPKFKELANMGESRLYQAMNKYGTKEYFKQVAMSN